ncbi:hypothetical protein M3P19_14260 [Muricauda sp. 2012CJ35-5]|uniref:Peptidase E n=1 Tax=Flagellimonas spongiicola TaxID=2942208 RepID=A0ABT0PUV8_9FLAO|nr:DUF6702 family protein [Allomuricauda spongiicola]MCL6275180.1 hypothetical protein [Allomuricauda spongiicola]
MKLLSAARLGILLTMTIMLMSFTTLHKFYLSVTNVVYSEKNDSFQITTRIFIDDLEDVLNERYGIDAKLATEDESKIAEDYIKKYLKTKFVMELDGQVASFNYLGKIYDNDVIICYLEIEDVAFDGLKSIAVQNEVLTDLFEDQQNIVHFKWKNNKRSFVLIKENNKGMLNL